MGAALGPARPVYLLMIDFYPIVKVNGEWKVDPEPMGTKRKFWYLEPGSDVSWLFKYPREDTGEHWAEKIAAEVAEVLEIRHAYVELAEIEGGQDGPPPVRGSTTRSFLDDGSVLIHGNEIMARVLSDYHRDLRFGQFFHTFENILIGLEMAIRDFSGVGESQPKILPVLGVGCAGRKH